MIADNDAFIAALKQAAKTSVPKGVHLSLSIDSVLSAAAAAPDNALIQKVQQARQRIGLQRGAVAYRTGITDAVWTWLFTGQVMTPRTKPMNMLTSKTCSTVLRFTKMSLKIISVD